MTDIAALIADMVRAGVDPDIIGRTAAAIAERDTVFVADAQAERRRSADRERKRAAVLRNSAESAERVDSPAPLSPPDKETPPAPPKEINPPIPPTQHIQGATPRERLEAVLDEERAGAVLDHRKRIGKPMTAHGAKLLAAKFAQCPDPNAAADAMIANGWQGFEPGWLERREVSVRAPPKREDSVSDVIARLKTEMAQADDEPNPYPDRNRPPALALFSGERGWDA